MAPPSLWEHKEVCFSAISRRRMVSGGRTLRTLVSVIMNILVVIAVLVTIRMVVQFFGSLSGQPWGGAIVSISDIFVFPLGLSEIKTPYGGVFEIAAALSIVILLGVEWVLSVVRWQL